jgi:acetyl esterase/lipase
MDYRDAKHIVIAGDSAGGGLCVALMIILRDQGLPMPAGASLISPWVDLTHSFPSITIPTEFDYVPNYGFHAKPNLSWPPPTSDERRAMGLSENPNREPDFEVEIDGQTIILQDQFQMYAANLHLQIPLVSSVCAASLGGKQVLEAFI